MLVLSVTDRLGVSCMVALVLVMDIDVVVEMIEVRELIIVSELLSV